MCKAWIHLGSKWAQIAALMQRSEYWVKRHWKILLKSEHIAISWTARPEERKRLIEGVVQKFQSLSTISTQAELLIAPESRPKLNEGIALQWDVDKPTDPRVDNYEIAEERKAYGPTNSGRSSLDSDGGQNESWRAECLMDAGVDGSAIGVTYQM